MYTYNAKDPNDIPNLSELLVPGGKWYSTTLFSSTKKPGIYWSYCNLNFGIIGTIVEAISGVRFDMFVKKHILDPLHISGSFNVADIYGWEDISTLYVGEDGKWVP